MATRTINSNHTAAANQVAARDTTPTQPRHPFGNHYVDDLEDVPDEIILKLVTRKIHREAKDIARRQTMGSIQLDDHGMLGCTEDEMRHSKHSEEYVKQYRSLYLYIARERLQQGNV